MKYRTSDCHPNRKRRVKLGVSLLDLSSVMGKPLTSVWRWETYNAKPSEDDMKAWEDALSSFESEIGGD